MIPMFCLYYTVIFLTAPFRKVAGCLGKFHILRTENLCGKRFCLFCVREEGSRSLSRQNLCHGKCAAPHAEEEGQCQQKKYQTCQI